MAKHKWKNKLNQQAKKEYIGLYMHIDITPDITIRLHHFGNGKSIKQLIKKKSKTINTILKKQQARESMPEN